MAIKACTSAGSTGQPHRVGDMTAALPDDFGDVFLAAFEFVRERVIALRLFHRIQVFALRSR